MKVFLATPATIGQYDRKALEADEKRLYTLESFYYIKDWMIPYIKDHWDFLLDSGAFTFMNGRESEANWDVYVERYAKFINENNVDKFFELDIDVVVGINEVERLRRKLENLTGKKSIPVWHKSRGKKYWIDLVKEYDYIALGGIAIKEIKRKQYPIFNWFLKKAREHDCKVHGLGFTNTRILHEYPFYSVDSTAWVYGNIGGYIYKFNGYHMTQLRGDGRLKSKEVAIHNFKEWKKFQKYADIYL